MPSAPLFRGDGSDRPVAQQFGLGDSEDIVGPTLHTVLFAVHDPYQMMLWSRAFEATARWRVCARVCTLAQASRALLAQRPDLLLTDLRLIDGTAIDLMQVLRTGLKPLPTQMLIVARESDQRLLIQALLDGADNFVSAESTSPSALVQQGLATLAGSAEIAPCVARSLLEHFDDDPPDQPGPARRPAAIEDLSNPLNLTDAERSLLRRLSNGFRVTEIAQVDGVRPRELTGRVRQICRKLLWQLRAGNLRLQTGWGGI